MATTTGRVIIPSQAFDVVPYLAKPIQTDREFTCLAFYVNDVWSCWLPHGAKLVKVRMVPTDANYFGDKPERQTDQLFPLLDFIAQRASFSEVILFFYGIWNDYQSLAATLAKLKVFFDIKDGQYEVRRFVQTEVEYIVLVCRSLFDLLQELLSVFCRRFAFKGKNKRILPKSFADVVTSGGHIRTESEIEKKYYVPATVAKWYVAHTDFFLQLRAMRDRLVHSGEVPVDMVYPTDKGFAINKELRPFCEFYHWPTGSEIENGLVPLRPVVCLLVERVLVVCREFAAAIQDEVQFPEAMAPALHLYTRGSFDKELCEIDDVVNSGAW